MKKLEEFNKIDWSAYLHDIVLPNQNAPYKQIPSQEEQKILAKQLTIAPQYVLALFEHYKMIPDICFVDLCWHHFNLHSTLSLFSLDNYLKAKTLLALPCTVPIHPKNKVIFFLAKHLQQASDNEAVFPTDTPTPPQSPTRSNFIRDFNRPPQPAMNWTEFFKTIVKIPQLPLSKTSTFENVSESRAKEVLDIIMSTLQKYPNGIPELCLVAVCNQYQIITHEEIATILKYALGKNLIFILAYFPKIHPQSQYKFLV